MKINQRQTLMPHFARGMWVAAMLLSLSVLPATARVLGQGEAGKDRQVRLGPLVETAWLADYFSDAKIRIVDMRPETEYTKGHIPFSVQFDGSKLRTADKDLIFLPTAEDFAKVMGEMGVDAESLVIVYDGTGGNLAARLWWVLDYFGHQRVSLLNGGWTKWTGESRPVSSDVPKIAKRPFVARGERPSVCTAEHLMGSIKKPDIVIIDARSPEEFSGERALSKRAGHVPGAVNIDWHRNLNPDLTFRPIAELKEMYARAGVTEGKQVITYCQTGGRAAHAFFALRLIGVTKARNYYGSWADWGNREDTPIEKEKTP